MTATATPYLPLAVLEWIFEALDPVGLPRESGSLWHGVFGKALRRLHCTDLKRECPDCPLLHGCDYPYLFQRIAPPDSAMMANKPVPAPHVLRPLFQAVTVQPGQVLPLGIVLVGDAVARWNHVLSALRQAGMAGIGRERGRLRLEEVNQIHLESEKVVSLWKGGSVTAVPAPAMPTPPPCPGEVRLVLMTPYRPASARVPFDGTRLAMAVVRRVSLMQYFYTGKRLLADFKALKAQASRIAVKGHKFKWKQGRRFSARHGGTADTSGWTGCCRLSLKGAEALWPYLWLGQWLGVGKNASMGFGWYSLSCEGGNDGGDNDQDGNGDKKGR